MNNLKDKASAYSIPGLYKNNTPDGIKYNVEQMTGIKIDMISRSRPVVEARQIAHFICINRTRSSLSYIGFICGKKDHATVLHSCKTVVALLETNAKYREQYRHIFEFYEFSIA